MANVSTYSWSNGSFEPSIAPLYQFAPSASDRKLVTTTACTSFSTFDPSVSLVWWASSGGGFMVRFGTNAPSATCGMCFSAGASGVWSSSMAACAKFISQNATAASIYAILLV